jgi:hypothetical protein
MKASMTAAALLCTIAVSATAADAIPAGWQAKDVKPISYLKLQAQRGFKLTLKKTDADRWYLFVGTTTPGGFHVIDVTDPAKPTIAKVIEVERGSAQVTSAGDLLLLGAQLPFTDRGTPRPFRQPPQDLELVTLWDIKDPLNPQRLSSFAARGWGTHRNGYFGGKYAYLAAFVDGYQGQSILLTLDVSDPKNPREVGRWWWPGQQDNDGVEHIPTAFHGAPALNADGTMMTLAYAPGIVNLDLRDAANPKIVGKILFSPLTQVGPPSMHTVMRLQNDYLLFATEPEKPGCENETLAQAGIINNRDPANPLLVARFGRPSAPPKAKYKTFCELKGRFGLHNVNAETHLSITEKPAKRIFATYFLAGLRVYDIANPLFPTEVAYFVPPIPDWDKGQRGVEDVLVDTRGYIYMTNGAEGGIWIVSYTGMANN